MNLVDVFKPGYVKVPLKKSTKTEIIKELVELLDKNKAISNPGGIIEAVFEREKIMTTGVGNGVAIPHCKHKGTRNFAVALGIHYQGIDFESIDKKPAKIIFLLVGPEDQPGTHIKLLSRISRIISKDEVRERVLDCKTSPELFDLIKDEEKHFTVG
jgi:fructose-specific phosphotransferase system IIA component